MRMNKYEKGMAPAQMMMLLLVLMVLGKVGFTIIPPFLDNRSLNSTVMSISKEYESVNSEDITTAEIREKLEKYFTVNMVDGTMLEYAEMDRSEREFILSINYEVRETLFSNVDVIITFTNEAEIGR